MTETECETECYF